MNDRHITDILDQQSFAKLGDETKEVLLAHTRDCQSCRREYEAARVASTLLRAENEIIAPPFFQAKVMNAWREKQKSATRSIAAFSRWWQASAAMIAVMVTLVFGLIALMLLAPSAAATEQADGATFNLYSPEAVILPQSQPRDLTNDQVFQAVYSSARSSDFSK